MKADVRAEIERIDSELADIRRCVFFGFEKRAAPENLAAYNRIKALGPAAKGSWPASPGPALPVGRDRLGRLAYEGDKAIMERLMGGFAIGTVQAATAAGGAWVRVQDTVGAPLSATVIWERGPNAPREEPNE